MDILIYASSLVLVLTLIFGIIATFWAFTKKQYKERENHLSDIIKERESIMAYISDELHDNVNQIQNYILMEMRGILTRDNPQAETFTVIEELVELLEDLTTETRFLSHSLNNTTVLKEGFQSSLNEMKTRIERSGLISFQIDFNEEPDTYLPPTIALSLFRIIQEAVQNSMKYAKADLLNIVLNRDNNNLNLKIKDNGTGNSDLKEGQGISSMRKRVEAIHGNMSLHSAPDEGTTVTIAINDFPRKWKNKSGKTIKTFDDYRS